MNQVTNTDTDGAIEESTSVCPATRAPSTIRFDLDPWIYVDRLRVRWLDIETLDYRPAKLIG